MLRPVETVTQARFVALGPLSSSPGSRAFLAYENGPQGPMWPLVVVWVPEDVEADPERMTQLQEDTARAALLEHPNVNRVVGCEQLEEGWARIVEFGDGETVRRVLQAVQRAGRPGLSPKVVARIIADTAAGTHYVHELGQTEGNVRWRLHGAIKPETVIVGFDGVSKITGYGANAVAPRDAFGPMASFRSQYLSPEEIERGPGSTDRRSDVYSLGLVLYEAIAGKPPWSAEDPAFEYKVLSEPLPMEPLGTAPDALKEIVVKALARVPTSRYATAGLMAEALEAASPAQHADVAADLARLFPPEGPDRAARRQLLMSAGFVGEKLPRPQVRKISKAAEPAATATAPATPTPTATPAATRTPTGTGTPTAKRTATSPPSLSLQRASTGKLPPRTQGYEIETTPPPQHRGVPVWLVVVAILGSAAAAAVVVYLATYRVPPTLFVPPGSMPSAPKVAVDVPTPPPLPPTLPLPTSLPGSPQPPAVPAPPGATATAPVIDLPLAPLAPAAPVTPATVDLASSPSMSVTVDGVAKGSTPETLTLAPGSHTIHFRDKAHGVDEERSVRLKSGGHASVSIQLPKAGMELTAPPGSQVYIDGKSVGVAPLGTLSFYAGHHVIKVKMGTAVFERPFDAEENETLTLDVHPEQVP
jgi:serine/threonine-protein kinase